jgi:hypothetical protein
MGERRRQAANADRNSVYIGALLKLPSTTFFGCTPYQVTTAIFNGQSQPNSIITEVLNGVAALRVQSTLTIELGGRYERLTALLGRDDKLSVEGPAYCIYEVHLDGEKAFRSEAICSKIGTVIADGSGFPKRRAPQPLDLSVRGARSLRLITRYANEFSQSGRHVHRASGCVWGGAMLIGRTAVDLGQQVGGGALRDALRKTVVEILDVVPAAKGKEPLKVGIPPIRIENSGDSPLQTQSEITLRNDLTTQLTSIKRLGRAPLVALSGADAEALSAALPVDGSARGNAAAVAAIARGFKADLLVFGALAPVGTDWKVTLRLVETTKGAVLKEAVATFPAPPK